MLLNWRSYKMSEEYFAIPQQKPNDSLKHYGVKFKSGRYPYGSGDIPYQHDPGFTWGDGKEGKIEPQKNLNVPQKKPMIITAKQAAKNSGSFQEYVNDMRRQGFTDKEIASSVRMSIREMKAAITGEELSRTYAYIQEANKLYSELGNKSEVAKRMGVSEGTVRNYLKEGAINKSAELANTKDMIKKALDNNISIDISFGVAYRLGVPQATFEAAVQALRTEGYQKIKVKYNQLGVNKQANRIVLAKPEEEWKNVVNNPDKIYLFNDTYTEDGGRTWSNLEKPKQISLDRVKVRYAEEGGSERDGLIEIRPGVKDLDMGSNNYAQVRIAVEGNKYMKGVAIYNADAFRNLPEGVDIIYNSVKKPGKVFKEYEKITEGPKAGEIDWDNPFGSAIKANKFDENGNLIKEVGQRHYIDPITGKKELSAINIVNEQGDWEKWGRTLSAQFLSKQRPELAKQQLKLTYDRKVRDLEEIEALTNPEIKKKLLLNFADECDSASVHLKAAAMPGQQVHVLIPYPNMKPDEIYAPNYKNGEYVSLIRYPHSGVFEIPTLRVNNNIPGAKRLLKAGALDAVAVAKPVAEQLSGADFDGDTVTIIPNPDKKVIKSEPYLDGLVGFDTKTSYPAYPGMKKVGMKKGIDPDTMKPKAETYDGFNTQLEMGKITNLIADMTLGGVTTKGDASSDLVRAVKYSMLVIDAEKHNLDHKRAYKDLGIAELKKKYRGSANKGAATLITRAKHDKEVTQRTGTFYIDPNTGKITYKEINPEDPRSYSKKKITVLNPKTGLKETVGYEQTGKMKTQKLPEMLTVDDAYELSSGTKMEAIYADYANSMKALAAKARKEYANTPSTTKNKEAVQMYKKEVEELESQWKNIVKNKPLEAKAQMLANSIMKIKKKEHPEWEYDDIKKHSARALSEARQRLGYSRYMFHITPKQWEAIESGALSSELIKNILRYTDNDEIKKYAMPKDYKPKLSTTEIALARSMTGRYTQAEIAEHFGISVSTLNRLLNE